ncbi:MAG: TolC family protein [Planctomycetes bacterium]|nr:TolC family protein [Planctomycetota bacterium]
MRLFRAGRQLQVIATAVFVMLVSSGCQIPNLRPADSGRDLPENFNGAASTENSTEIGIDEFFGDSSLTQLIEYGLSQNQELKIRNQEIEIASNEIMARRGAYLPFVTVGGGGGYQRASRWTPLGAAEDQLMAPGGRLFPNPVPSTGLSANLFWQIDIWRQLRNSRDAAIQRYVEAIESRDYLITRLVADTADNYYELAALDQRLVYLNQTIALQQKSLEVAKAQKDAARGTELGVQRFQAEVRKNESQKLIVNQKIIEVGNRINFLVGRYPQQVDRQSWDFIKLDSRMLSVGVPAQLLQNRRDILAAEREIAASGLDVQVARANFYPKLFLTAGVGYEAFNPRYLFDPGAFAANAAGELIAPLINKNAIRANYLNANARQLQAVYNYQRTVLNAFIEVVNRLAKVENYRTSVAIKQEQVKALEASVDAATGLYLAAHPDVEYIDVLFAQRDLLEARTVLIETKQQQLSAIVNVYQALGGGLLQGGKLPGSDEILLQPLPPELDEPIPPPPATPDNAGTARLDTDADNWAAMTIKDNASAPSLRALQFHEPDDILAP